MSPKGRPEGEYRSAQHEGSPLSPKGRPEGEYRSAQHEGSPVSAAGPPQGDRPLGGAARSAVRGEHTRLTVTVAYAAPGVEAVVTLTMAPGATVADAVAASGVVERLALPSAAIGFALHGQRADRDTPVADGDRIELTRPLRADPKQVRRARAARNASGERVPRRKQGPAATS